jgi:hypothetical protein
MLKPVMMFDDRWWVMSSSIPVVVDGLIEVGEGEEE